MKKGRMLFTVSFILVMVMTFTACAGKAKMENSLAYDTADRDEGNYDNGSTGSTEEAKETPAEKPKADTQYTSQSGTLNNSSSITMEDSVAAQTQDKIIRTFYMDVETQEFDSLITMLDSEINRLNGYVESSQIKGRSIYNREGARYASVIARVPRDKVDEFVNAVGENANVINKQESSDNVTLQYTDIESRKKSLEIEQERLFALLEKTDTLENIVILESRLSDIRYELQNYESTLRTYDNKVEYSTVTLSVQEVERITPKVEIKQTVGTRIQNGFNSTIYNLSEGFKNFFVWFVVNLPYLLIWGVIFLVIALIVRRSLKKRVRDSIPPLPPVSPMNQQDNKTDR